MAEAASDTATPGGPVPAIEGWFTLDADRPRLLGSRCTGCGTYAFPPRSAGSCPNPACASDAFEQVELSERGTIWSYTENHYEPPEPYVSDGEFKPYAVVAVELAAEKLIVLGKLADGATLADLKVGGEAELVVERLFADDEGERLVWKWRPVGG